MAHRSQRSSLEDNPLDPNYLPPHYREEYRLAIDALVEHGLQGYYEFLQNAGVVEFLSHPEVEHILNTVQSPRQSSQPDLLYQEPEADGSSDTYWPVHSDLEAPVLDLGWPVHHSFIGPTEVTTLVNPSDPEMPSIKAQARQLIKRAQQVIAVAMDMFTDIDIFSDLLNAAMRNVAVYILLDEQNAHHFTAMVSSCRVNLAMVKTMRVRTVSGTTYFCRTGKSFKGQMMDRFLLVDCRAVLSGNYSFMWMFEKIHRSIAHLFLGELVTTFDEEFRILYAQSEPLVMEDALGLVSGGSSYSSKQFSSTRPSVSRNPRYLHAETPHFLELPGYPTEGHMDTQRSMSAFRRDEPCPGYLDREPLQKYGNRYSSQELNVERSFLDHDRPVISRQMDMDAYKRHSYTEGTSASSRQFVQHHMKHYPEELESFSRHPGEHHYYHPGGGSGSGHAVYDHVRAHGYHQTDPAPDQYEPGLHPEPEPPGSYSHMVDYLSSDSSREMRYGYGEKPAPAEGWYGRSGTKRPSLGQPYACQTSPTQPHPPDQKHLFTKASLEHQPRDPGSKQGLRKWRINSYLSTLEKSGEEGLAEPLGPDAFDESSNPFTEEQHDLQTAVPRFSNRDNAQIPSSKLDFLPRFGKPMLPKASKDLPEDQPSTGKESPVTTQVAPASGLASNTEGDKAVEVVFRKPRDIMQQESFRTRPNISLLRSSRLRSSLIFSSSQVEQHFSMETKPESEVSGAENPTVEKEALKKSSILAEILEKRKYLPREPISRSSLKQSKPDLSLKDIAVPEDSSEGSSKMLGASDSCGIAVNEMPKDPAQKDQLKDVSEDQTKKAVKREPTKPLSSTEFDMDDPESRLLYFKELAAKRKASKMAQESGIEKAENSVKNEDLPRAHSESSNETQQLVSDSTSVSGSLEQPKDLTNDQKVKQLQASNEEQIKAAVPKELSKPSPNLLSVLNMNDPESRLLYFKQLAAKQKASKMAMESTAKTPECGVKNEDRSEASAESSNEKLLVSDSVVISGDVEVPKGPTHEQCKNKSMEQTKVTPMEPPQPSHTTPECSSENPELAVESLDLSKAPPESSCHNPRVLPTKDPLHEQQMEQSNTAHEEQAKLRVPAEPLPSSSTTTSRVDVNDPESRFLYFKELAAKQKTLKIAMESVVLSPQPPVQKTDDSEGSEVSVTEEHSSVIHGSAKITENPDEQSSVKHPEISQSSPKVPEKPEEHHSITQPESPPKVSSEKPEEHPSVPTPESVSTEKPEERPSITQPEISETPPTSSTEKFDALPTVAEPDISISGAVEIGPEKPVMSAEPSKVSLIPSESVVRASEVTLESSQSVAMKQDPQSSGEYVNPMAEETKREPEPKPTPCSLQGDTLRSPLPASAHTHALPSDEELMKDATDAEKSEWMKSRGQRPSGVALGELGETLPRGSSTSPDSVGISRDRNETERPVGLLGSEGAGNTVNEDMPSAPEQPNHEGGETSSTAATDATKMAKSKEQEADHSQVPSAASRTSPSRYQASTTNVLYSSNLRDDTKVILEQISANSQSRMELAKQQTAAITDDAKEVDREQTADKAPENRMPGRGFSRFQRSTISSEDRETLLKKMESMRKEKKVYSRFELGS